MVVLKVTTVCFLILVVQADKKIELQDIEEDNLRSEKEKDYVQSDGSQQTSSPSQGLVHLDFLKNGLSNYFENPTVSPHPQRYVHQYAVTEQPERPVSASEPQYSSPAPQQAMVGYLSNVPMQIYLVPQYQQSTDAARAVAYQKGVETVQKQANFIQGSTYTPPTAQPYVQQYTPSVTYLGFPSQPTAAPLQVTVAPAVTYPVSVVQYTSAIIQPTAATKTYYQNPSYSENSVSEIQRPEYDHRQYNSPSSYPRLYNSRAPYRDNYRGHSNSITELPRPNPLLLKAPPAHLSHIPKVLPMHRPFAKPGYQIGVTSHSSLSQSHNTYLPPQYKRRPASLLDSYIPSSVQVEYLKRGIIKDPLVLYEALASGRLSHPGPRHYEKGFLPNQMYHTAAGGVTFGHQKRSTNTD